MASWPRTVGEIVSALAAALGWVLNFSGADGATWQVLAFGGSCVFVGLITWHIYSQNQELHADEKAIVMTAQPNLMPNLPWAEGTSQGGFTLMLFASVIVTVRNNAQYPIRMSRIYLEVRDRSVLPRSRIRLEPYHWGRDADWYKRAKPDLVEWLLPAIGEEQSVKAYFNKFWASGVGPIRPNSGALHARLIGELGNESRRVSVELERIKVNADKDA